jgi:hypothetical protein
MHMTRVADLFDEPKKKTRLSLDSVVSPLEPSSIKPAVESRFSGVESIFDTANFPPFYKITKEDVSAGNELSKKLAQTMANVKDKSLAKRIEERGGAFGDTDVMSKRITVSNVVSIDHGLVEVTDERGARYIVKFIGTSADPFHTKNTVIEVLKMTKTAVGDIVSDYRVS